jgi:uncharacterized protein
MTTNPSPEYGHAVKQYNEASSPEEKIEAMEEMIRTMPQHKSAENLRANITTRYKKLLESVEKSKKSGKTKIKGIKKESMQAVLLGFPNSGKSSVFKSLTGVKAVISPHAYTTRVPEVGMMQVQDTQIQILDMPAFPNQDSGIVNSTDLAIIIIENLDQVPQAEELIKKSRAKKLIVLNKVDSLDESQRRKVQATANSKKIPIIFFSSFTQEGLEELKKKIFNSFSIARIYLKEPKKPATTQPLIMKQDSDVYDVAEKILKGFSKRVKKTRIWGPSSKFPGQEVGLNHKLKDKDIVEFQTS